jgi:hypothetical protein
MCCPERTRALSNRVESESTPDSLFDRIFRGKPVPTFPENALASQANYHGSGDAKDAIKGARTS